MYLTLVLAATATPGPAVLFIMTNASLYGWQKAINAALGNIVGLLCLGILSVAGLGTVLKTSEMIFTVIKYAGAAYLIYLGLKLVKQKNIDFTNPKALNPIHAASGPHIFWQALGVALSNPKAIIFLTALFPQFIDIKSALVPQFAVLIAVLMVFSFVFLMLYAVMAHQAKVWLVKPNRVKFVNRTSGTIFIGFGLLLAASSHR
jgi:threonine/homoserine/homoserine lactone efflux protein